MIKKILTTTILLATTSMLAQFSKVNSSSISKLKEPNAKLENQHKHGKLIKCATDEAMEEVFRNDPSARLRYEQAQKDMGAWENSTN